MKIVFVLPLISKNGAGVAEAPKGLAVALARHGGLKVDALALEDEDSKDSRRLWPGVDCHLLKPGPFGFVCGLSNTLEALKPDVLHIHGLWVGIGIQAAAWARKNKVPYVLSPHGMMDAWAMRHSRWKKILFWHFLQKRAIHSAAILHALNEPEQRAIEALIPGSNCVDIPNGVDFTPHVPASSKHQNSKRLLFLGRLHPKKGVKELVQAWVELLRTDSTNDWILEIAGSGSSDYQNELILAAGKYLDHKIIFTGHVYEAEKTACFERASAFILPSKSEGLPVAILEAWSYKLPVAMTLECNLPLALEMNAAYQVFKEADHLKDSLREFLALPMEELEILGKKGFALVSEKYSWKHVAKDFIKTYSAIVAA